MATYPNDSAYPMALSDTDHLDKGLSIREYFAAMAMQGIMANNSYAGNQQSVVALYAVAAADALIKELNK